MAEAYIQSRQNDQVKNLVKLRERKHRDRQERFLVEGLTRNWPCDRSRIHRRPTLFLPRMLPERGSHSIH